MLRSPLSVLVQVPARAADLLFLAEQRRLLPDPLRPHRVRCLGTPSYERTDFVESLQIEV